MTTFASVGELATLLDETLAGDDAKATLLLEMATAAIQSDAQHDIFQVTEDEVELVGNWGPELWLPEPPVTAVSEVVVTVNAYAETLATTGYRWRRDGLLLRGVVDIEDIPGYWGGDHAKVQVTYTHGYATVPGDIKAVCLQAAQRAYENPTGITQETIGTYSVTHARLDPGVMLSVGERDIVRRYRPVVNR